MMQTFKQGNKLLAGGSTGNCSCFSGTAYLDAAGGCNCHPNAGIPPFPFSGTGSEQASWRNTYLGIEGHPTEIDASIPTGGIKAPPGMKWTPAGWVPLNTKPGAGSATGSVENTIFGFSPWVVLGAAVAGLWLLSNMDGKK